MTLEQLSNVVTLFIFAVLVVMFVTPPLVRGLIGMGAMSYGALGSHAIRALSQGLGLATGSWINTGEGGLSEHHLCGGGDVIFQIGPGLFGVRDGDGGWDWEAFRRWAATEQVRGFELKLHQGAKIRGGHVEGAKVSAEVAALRGIPAGRSIDSPNRFELFAGVEGLLDWVARMRETGGKPVGVKISVGGPGFADELCAALARRGGGLDWLAIDGGEGAPARPTRRWRTGWRSPSARASW
jgi:glutamate synthase (ferredoxin)